MAAVPTTEPMRDEGRPSRGSAPIGRFAGGHQDKLTRDHEQVRPVGRQGRLGPYMGIRGQDAFTGAPRGLRQARWHWRQKKQPGSSMYSVTRALPSRCSVRPDVPKRRGTTREPRPRARPPPEVPPGSAPLPQKAVLGRQLPGGGVGSASSGPSVGTGRPRSVTTMTAPLRARATHGLSCGFNRRMPTWVTDGCP